jgi:pimeloyl-ACP methyl ester carboxylesterase
MVHGAGGGAWEWNVWRREFENRGWTVVTPELTPSSQGLAATRFADYLNQILDFKSYPAGNGLALIGASLGGLLALVAENVLQPAALVLVNSVPPKHVARLTPHDYPPVVQWHGKGWEESRTAMPDCDESTQRFAATRWRDESGSVLNSLLAGIEARLPRCPVLVIAGEADTDVPVSIAHAIARWTKADLQIYPGVSHVGPLLSPQADHIARKALDWLEDSWGK